MRTGKPSGSSNATAGGQDSAHNGAARGIGRAFGEAYAREGASVAIAELNLGAAEEAAGKIGEKATAVAMAVTKQESIDTAIAATVAKLGGIDILINNAALFSGAPHDGTWQGLGE